MLFISLTVPTLPQVGPTYSFRVSTDLLFAALQERYLCSLVLRSMLCDAPKEVECQELALVSRRTAILGICCAAWLPNNPNVPTDDTVRTHIT